MRSDRLFAWRPRRTLRVSAVCRACAYRHHDLRLRRGRDRNSRPGLIWCGATAPGRRTPSSVRARRSRHPAALFTHRLSNAASRPPHPPRVRDDRDTPLGGDRVNRNISLYKFIVNYPARGFHTEMNKNRNIRIERRGGAPDLQTAFARLVIERFKGRSLDENKDKESAEGKFPDFSYFGDLVLIEMKHLESDQRDRVNAIIRTQALSDEMPHFYGSRKSDSILDAVSNGSDISANVASKLSRTIEGPLSHANKQFESYRKRNPRKNSVNICVILNAKLVEYSPDLIAHAINRKMGVSSTQGVRFPSIDAVLYISEKHIQLTPNGQMAMPIVIYEHFGVEQHPWKSQLVTQLANEWSQARSRSHVIEGTDPRNFSEIVDVPRSKTRSEAWTLEYQRDPYLSQVPVNLLRRMFHRTIAVNSQTFVKGNWPDQPQDELQQSLQMFQHIIEETNRRGIDLRDFDRKYLTSEDRKMIYAGLPDELIELLDPKDGDAN